MTRSTFLLGVGGAAVLAASRPPAAAQGRPRNVLWIMDDDHPSYMMSPMPLVQREIGTAGTEVLGGHADVPLCGPARVSALTGLSVTTHGCDTNRTTYQDFLSAGLEDRMVARWMREAGYVTGHFGKYVNGHDGATDVPPHWDRWCETMGDGSDSGGDARSPNTGNVDGAWVDIQDGLRPSIWAAEHCATFVRQSAGTPFFAHYCPSIPHEPYNPTAASEHLYDGDTRRVSSVNEKDMRDKPMWMRQLPKQDVKAIQREFEGKKEELADLDHSCVRPILEALAEAGELQNTVIFFTSDNGYMHGEHRLRKKDQPYWESSMVPFLAKGPGVGVGARLAPAVLANHTDLAPTTCEIAGVDPLSLGVDGRSMLSLLGSGQDAGWRKRMLVTGSDVAGPGKPNPGGANNPSGRWWLLREGQRVFILHENGQKELYNMDTDPLQKNNRIRAAKPNLVRHLVATTKAMRSASGARRRSLEQ